MHLTKHHFDSLSSTQTWSKENKHAFDPLKITLVSTGHQTGGYGQQKRKWISLPNKSLAATFAFQTDKPEAITQILALTATQVIKCDDVKLKWPNDLVIHGKKLGGVLAEYQAPWIFAGIGINVSQTEEELKEIDRPAISLLMATKKLFSISSLLDTLAEQFIKNLSLYQAEGFIPFHELFIQKLAHKRGDKLVLNGNQITFEGIGINGSLLGDGKNYFSGEII